MGKDSKRLVWFEGMTLDPHHFQQWDRHRDGVIDARLRAVAPEGWGLASCSIDEERLANGELSVKECTCVMPDGLVVDVPDVSPAPDVRNVKEHLSATNDRIRVLLSVPAGRPNGRNVTLQGSTHNRETRFVAESKRVLDENTGDNKRPVEVAHTNVQIRFADESQQGFSTLPIAEVQRAGGGFALSDEFVPPALYLRASDRLMEMTRQMLELLVSKSSNLSEHQDEIVGQREFSPSDILSLNLLGTLNAFIPVLSQHHVSGNSHPRDLLTTLTSLAGQLSTYVDGATVQPRNLPTYDHNAPSEAFNAIETTLRQMLGEATPSSSYQQFPFHAESESLFVADVDGGVLEDARLFLQARSDQHTETQLSNGLPEMLRVASPDTIDGVLQSYTQALNIEPTQRVPANMPVDKQATYFKVEKRGPFWEAILDEKGIAIFVPSDWEVELELMATS